MHNLIRISNYLVIIAISLFILLAAYFQGLFFDTDLYLVEIIISLLFTFFIVVNYKRLIALFAEPYIWVLIAIDIIYLVNSFSTIGQLSSYQQFFRWFMVTELFILVLLIKNKVWTSNLFWFSLIVAGLWTSIFGWLAVYNLVEFKDALLDYRITSVFQYANSFGALLAAILIGVLIRGTSNKWVYSLTSITTYLLTITIIFTYSRGTWLLLPIVWIIGLFFLPFKKQLLYILHTLLIGIAVVLTLSPINDTITNNSYVKGFIIIGIASIIVGLIYSTLSYIISKVNLPTKSDILRWFLPIISIIIIIIGLVLITSPAFIEKLPDTLEKRVEDINIETQSVQERGVFYKDASELIKDSFLFGHGGGAWEELYNSYKSYPYVSTQAHNFYFQLAVESGIVGLILLISLLLLILISIIKNRKNLAEDEYSRILSLGLTAFFLLVHSLIDFNMSYAYILGVTMILLALLAYPLPTRMSKNKAISYICIILIGIMLVTSFVNTSKFFYANSINKNMENYSTEEMNIQLERLISLNPYNLDYRFKKIDFHYNLYKQSNYEETKQKILDEILYINSTNPQDTGYILKLSQTAAYMGYYLDAIQILEDSLNKMMWEEELYEQYFMFSFELAKYYQTSGDTHNAEEALNRILDYYGQFLDRREFLDTQIESLQYKDFKPTQYMNLYAGKIYIVHGEYDKGLNLLIPLTKNKSQDIKEDAIVWTVYAYQQKNMQNKASNYLKIGEEFDVLNKVEDIRYVWDR